MGKKVEFNSFETELLHHALLALKDNHVREMEYSHRLSNMGYMEDSKAKINEIDSLISKLILGI